MRINLLLDGMQSTYDTLKFSALYFDTVKIKAKNKRYSVTSFFDENIFDDINILVDSGIASIDRDNFELTMGNLYRYVKQNEKYDYYKKECPFIDDYLQIFSLIQRLYDDMEQHPIEIQTEIRDTLDNLKELVECTLSNTKFTKTEQFKRSYWISAYYSNKLSMFLSSIYNNENVICDSKTIDYLVKSMYNDSNDSERLKNSIIKSETIKQEAMTIILPDFNKLSFESILEIRLKLKDELTEMRYYIDKLTNSFDFNDMSSTNQYLESNIKQSIEQFENKLFSFRTGIIQKIIRDIKNPISYAPLMTTFFANTPLIVSIAVSLGLIAADVGLEYSKTKKEIKTHPMYFYKRISNFTRKHVK